ncbi:hypothetical protein F5ESL0236_02520 [Lactobacillus sp. ESL0236]|uniref:hypothetical protein n=1 Tax=unclassified Lactobacillus TaxID=2620435 RepID=UPI000EFCA24C|nr:MULTISPECIES: hypothetical protein [unclassified Lactobacillus]RMC40801.1 hypothetical protein F5ESL0237_02520 [Lactobacillus sp. ESL0237]RMC44557.1 hypothetical protein F5ESL0234_02515 [Lactobacillus sp. ESL0234]RMC45864.1 hypothetical protein F5ESL0236_02520 [Lactobacillus sp. ESL0236]
MKSNKILTVLAAAAIGVSTATSLGAMQAQTSYAAAKQAKTVKPSKQAKAVKVAFGKSYTFPKEWAGKWYSNDLLRMEPLDFHKTGLGSPRSGEYAKAVTSAKLKGTNKYPWQMSADWQAKNAKELNKYVRVSKKKVNGIDWIIVTPVGKKSIDNGFAFAARTEKLNGKKETVIFEANPHVGAATQQYFRTKELADKYGKHQFKNMEYSKWVLLRSKNK